MPTASIYCTTGAVLRVWHRQDFGRLSLRKETVMNMMNSEDSTVHEIPQNGGAGKAEANGDATVLNSLRESARVTTDALYDAGYKASAAVKEFGDGAYQAGSRAGARVARQVEAQPMTAALIAASLGLIIGVLLPRR
jgi:ElaB/YqjD/DUF883 family membrane-anchored ribosome-binding protein